MFTCDCVSRFVACDRPVSGNNRLVFFEDFSNLFYSCFSQKESNVCLLPSTKNPLISRFPPLFLSSLESFSVLFLLGECVASWFALTPSPLKWLTEQKNPFEVCKRGARCKEFGYKNAITDLSVHQMWYPTPCDGIRIPESGNVLHVESWILEIFSCVIRNPGPWNPESH